MLLMCPCCKCVVALAVLVVFWFGKGPRMHFVPARCVAHSFNCWFQFVPIVVERAIAMQIGFLAIEVARFWCASFVLSYMKCTFISP